MFRGLKNRLGGDLFTSLPGSPKEKDEGEAVSDVLPAEASSSIEKQVKSRAAAEDEPTADVLARYEKMGHSELATQLYKHAQLSKRYQRKLADIVVAYKEQTIRNKKLETALETQQDAAGSILHRV